MPLITKEQQVYCQLAQLSNAFYNGYKCKEEMLDDFLKTHDVNLKILTNKSSGGFFEGSTPLHIAYVQTQIGSFDVLLARGADFTATNNNGDTALHRAFCDTFSECKEDLNNISKISENKFVQSVLKAHVQYGIRENPRSADGLSHFHIACAANHLEAVELFLNEGVSANESVNAGASMFPGCTALHFATEFCGYATAKLLLERGADVTAKDAKGLTPLHLVIERNLQLSGLKDDGPKRVISRFGFTSFPDKEQLDRYKIDDEKIMRLFLESNLGMEVDNTGLNKFHAACTLGDSALIERFSRDVDVNCAVSVNSPMWPGYTALHFAIRSDVKTIKLLLKKGANIEAEDADGVTPFDLCMKQYDLEDLHHIFSEVPGFEDILFSDSETRLSDFIHAMRSFSTLSEFFETTPRDACLPRDCPIWPGSCLSHLLVYFSDFLSYDAMKTYFDCADNAMIQDARGRTFLHLAYYQKKREITNFFFERQQEVAEVIDNHGLSHVHVSCAMSTEDIVQTLLSQGANVNATHEGKRVSVKNVIRYGIHGQKGSTPLHIAVTRKNVELVEMLLKRGADVNASDADGVTPLHQLMYLQPIPDTHVAKTVERIGNTLLSTCGLTNVVSSETGLSHLHVASYNGNENAVRNLLDLGADPNAVISSDDPDSPLFYRSVQCFSGYTPLHFAVEKGNLTLMKLLLQGGADILSRKPNGMTLLYDVLIDNRDTFESTSISTSVTKFFTSMLAKDVKLRKTAEKDSGLTLLHIACFLRDAVQIKKLSADSRVNVSAQMHADSPIWPKATPLHLLIESTRQIKDLVSTVELLLDHGADVVPMDKKGDTPVHKAWLKWCKGRDSSNYEVLRLLLRHHEDFSVNPVNEAGISHFHLACLASEYTIVEKFLESGVDVNLPIDYRNETMTFQTPLRFMMEYLVDEKARLQTIDVLLKYEADVNVQDEKGLNALLETACREPPRELYLEKLYKAGIDINCTNMSGESALEILFCSTYPIKNQEIQFLLSHPSLFNTYNSVYRIGIIATMIDAQDASTQHRKFLETVINTPSLFTIDQKGRTPIHNIVANGGASITAEEYAHYIEKFMKMGYNVDAQDSEGKTALHLAADFENEKAISGLLIAGVDVNVTDSNSQTACTVLFNSRPRLHENAHILNGSKVSARNKIVRHMIGILSCGLELNTHDVELTNSERFEEKNRAYCEALSKELEETKLVTIGTSTLTLKDFLSETGAVASRPSMTCEDDRQAIDKFFESIDIERFPYLISVLKLQYRKAMARLRLMEEATHSVRKLLGSVNGFSMPELCCRIIIRFLTNTEVKYLIKSVSTTVLES